MSSRSAGIPGPAVERLAGAPLPTALDGAVGAATAAGLLLEGVLRDDLHDATVSKVALVLAVGLAASYRRRTPVTSLVLVLAGLAICLNTFECKRSAEAVLLLSVATVAYLGDRRRALVVAAAVVPVTLAVLAVVAQHAEASERAVNVVLVLAAVAVGDGARARRQASAAVRARALGEQAAHTQALVDAERIRLAREVHDTVAHALVAINTLAGVTAHRYDRHPESAPAALQDIKRTSAHALDDLRRTLGGLRSPSDGPPPLAPAARRLSDLPDLVHRVSSAHLEVRLEAPDALPDVDHAVQHAVYRIVQESLTNVLRHATASVVCVRLEVRGACLAVGVQDNGAEPRARAGQQPGQGLLGMRERATALGGTFHSGTAENQGWAVRAELPMHPRAR